METLKVTVLIFFVLTSGCAQEKLKVGVNCKSLQEKHDSLDLSYRRALFSAVASGDKCAFQIGLDIADELDGGELEDFYRASGIFFEKNPSFFINYISVSKVSLRHHKYLVTMLPLSYTDNLLGQKRTLEKRLSLVKKNINLRNRLVSQLFLSELQNALRYYK